MIPNLKIEEKISVAYLYLLASVNGFSLDLKSHQYDDYFGVDCKITAHGGKLLGTNEWFRVELDIQLKATINLKRLKDGTISFPLDIDNYQWLISEKNELQNLLVVMELPQNQKEWVTCKPELNFLLLRRSMYWINLRGYPAQELKNTKSIHIRNANRLTPESLADIMRRIARKEPLI